MRATRKGQHSTRKQVGCIECGEPLLSAGAAKCLKCGSYQHRLKRVLQFITTVAVGLSLLGAVSLYILDHASDIRRAFAWHSALRVIAFDSSKGLTVLNTGDGPILLSHLALEIEGVGTSSYEIAKTIKPLEMLQQDMPRPFATDRYVLIAHVSHEQWLAAVTAARSLSSQNCVYAAAFADTDPSYLTFAEAGRRDRHHFPWLHAIASLHYYDFRTGAGEVKIPAHAFLFRRSNCSDTQSAP